MMNSLTTVVTLQNTFTVIVYLIIIKALMFDRKQMKTNEYNEHKTHNELEANNLRDSTFTENDIKNLSTDTFQSATAYHTKSNSNK